MTRFCVPTDHAVFNKNIYRKIGVTVTQAVNLKV